MSELELARQLSFVDKIEIDDGFMSVDIRDVGHFTVQLAENYRKASSSYYGPSSQSGDLKPGALRDIVSQLHDIHTSTAIMREASTMSEEDSFSLAREPTEDTELSMAALMEDVNKFCRRFGQGSAVKLPHSSMDWVMLQVPVQSLMSSTVASAWGVRRDIPITVILKFAARFYVEDGRRPIVEIFQQKERFRLGQQMTRILTEYLTQHWSQNGFVPPKSSAPPAAGGNAALQPSSLSPQKRAIFDKLMEMDYDQNFACEAALNSSNIDEAVSYAPGQRTAVSAGSDTKVVASQFLNPESTRYNPSTDPEKMVPYNSAQGFLVHIAEVMIKRIPTSSKYCVICDKPHIFSTASMLRSSVCTRDMCVFAFHELKLGSDAAESVATDAGVVDLLLTIFRAAALSNRDHILDPYPKVPDPTNPTKLALNPNQKDLARLRSILQAFPSTKEVVRCDDLVALKDRLQTKDSCAYPLLEWVISSNRSHIVKMDPSHLLKEMETQHQFILLTAAPEKEAAFKAVKAKHSTKFAFHGSRAENWHCILRNGLKNMSGTKDQLNGAAHGAGIYFAPDANTSIGYCRSNDGSSVKNEDEFLSSGVMCLALCEIIDDGSTIKDHGWCWTVEAEDKVMTRFFFCFNGQKNVPADTRKDDFVQKVRAAMKYYNLD